MGTKFSSNKYEYRTGHSTIEAINKVMSIARSTMSWRMFDLDKSLDISNAYHSIPRAKQHALHRHSIPAYRRRFADKCARRLETVANRRLMERRHFVGSVLDRWVQWLVHGPEAISFIVTQHTCPDGARMLRHLPAQDRRSKYNGVRRQLCA